MADDIALGQLLDTALQAGRAAVEVHRARLGALGHLDWDEKGAADFVSEADHEAEARMMEVIRQRCPGHAFLAEEESTRDGGERLVTAAQDEAYLSRFEESPYLWILDPLDGTTNYLHRYPMYAASAAVSSSGEIVAGAVINGATGEEWSATAGGGAYRNGQRIRVSDVDTLSRALIGTGFPFKALELLPDYLRQFDGVLRSTSGVRRAGAAAMDLVHVASGYLDGFWELVLAPWDVAAGVLIIREAGGVVTDLDGDPDVRGGGAILAGNPAVHRLLFEQLKSLR